MLIDPTSSAGYSFGQILPSSHMTTIANQQPNAVDAKNGGSYDMGANGIVIVNNDTDPTLALQNGGAAPTLVAVHDHESVPAVAIVNAHSTDGVALGLSATGTNGKALVVTDGIIELAADSRITLLGTGDLVALAARNYVRAQDIYAGRDVDDYWQFGENHGTRSGWLLTDVAAQRGLYIPLNNLIDKATLTEVRVYFVGGAVSTHSALPATMPVIAVSKSPILTGVTSAVGSSATTGAGSTPSVTTAGQYDAVHSTAVTGLSEVITGEDRYRVVIGGEAGANSVANALLVYAVVCTFSCTLLTPGG